MRQIFKLLLCLLIVIGCVGCSSGKEIKAGNVNFKIPNDWTSVEEENESGDYFSIMRLKPKDDSSKQGSISLFYVCGDENYLTSSVLYLLHTDLAKSDNIECEIIDDGKDSYESINYFYSIEGELLAPITHFISRKINEKNYEAYYFLTSFEDCEDYTAINSIYDSIKYK